MLLSNLRLDDERAAQLALAERIVQAYRQRWAAGRPVQCRFAQDIENLFSWTKDALDWESVRLLDYEALRTLVALAWLAATFIFDLGATLEQPEVLFLATLGGWTPGKAKPGKAALCKGLAQLSHHLVLEHLAKDPAEAASLRRLTHDLLRS